MKRERLIKNLLLAVIFSGSKIWHNTLADGKLFQGIHEQDYCRKV